MFNKTKTKSQGSKKRFHMPKFPSAMVILFIVLVFVVVLSWIPHKGWVDASSPFLQFKGGETGFIYGNDGSVWGSYTVNPSSIDSLDEWTINFILAGPGETALRNYLAGFGLAPEIVEPIMEAATGGDGFLISGIDIPKDFYQSSINYSDLTFVLSFPGYTGNLPVKSVDVTIEQIVQPTPLVFDDEGALTSMNFSIISGSVDTNIIIPEAAGGNGEATFGTSFLASNGKSNYFNFWNTNYYMADVNGRYGLLNIPFIVLAGVFNAAGVILYLLCIGAFIEIMLQSGALEAGTSSLVKKLGGKELFLIPILFVLFCTGGTTYGMQEETLGLIPLIVPFLVLAGFDTMTGLLVVVVGTTMGIGSSVVNPFSVGVMSGALETSGAPEVEIATGITLRIIEFLVFCVVGSSFCTWYGWRSRKGAKYCAEPEMYEANKEWAQEMLGDAHANHAGLTKRQAWGLGIFAGTFALMIFSLLPWTSWFFKDGVDPKGFWFIFSSFFYSGRVFGEWYFVQLGMLFLATSFILGRVFGMNQKDTNKAVVDGAKSMLGIGMILMMSRAIGLVLSYSGLATGMISLMFGGGGGTEGSFSAAGLAWILLPMLALLAVFIPSTSGLAGITGPIIAPIIWTMSNGDAIAFAGYAAVVMAVYPLAQGIINMFMPTTGLVVAQAEVAKVNFGKAMPILMGCAAATALIGMTLISCAAPIYMGL